VVWCMVYICVKISERVLSTRMRIMVIDYIVNQKECFNSP